MQKYYLFQFSPVTLTYNISIYKELGSDSITNRNMIPDPYR